MVQWLNVQWLDRHGTMSPYQNYDSEPNLNQSVQCLCATGSPDLNRVSVGAPDINKTYNWWVRGRPSSVAPDMYRTDNWRSRAELRPGLKPLQLLAVNGSGAPGDRFNIKTPSYESRNSHDKDKMVLRPLRRSQDHLIFIMEIPYPKDGLYIETGPCCHWGYHLWEKCILMARWDLIYPIPWSLIARTLVKYNRSYPIWRPRNCRMKVAQNGATGS